MSRSEENTENSENSENKEIIELKKELKKLQDENKRFSEYLQAQIKQFEKAEQKIKKLLNVDIYLIPVGRWFDKEYK